MNKREIPDWLKDIVNPWWRERKAKQEEFLQKLFEATESKPLEKKEG